MKSAWWLLALLIGAGNIRAQPAAEGVPEPGKPLLDRDFGVGTHQFGLERQVEMYQWSASGDTYVPVWNSARIDSATFAPGHENPPALPLDSPRWWAERPMLDGNPIDPKVLRVLGTWQRFRPDFSRLPANLAASFQPEGDGLGSSENPLAPKVGDLRVHWRELLLPTLAGKLELRDGAWKLTREAAAAPAPTQPLIDLPATPDVPVGEWWPWLAAALLAFAAFWLLLRRRGRVRREEA